MLMVAKGLAQRRATNPEHGNVQTFLERLLVEVVSGNYRHFLHERVAFSSQKGVPVERPEELCWPPLLANERQVSGLFSSALSAVCPVSRPEEAIRRPVVGRRGKVKRSRNGRIDFAAVFGTRHIGLELKQIPISSLKAGTKQGAEELRGLKHRWTTVSRQAGEALVHMRGYKDEYHHPITVGLLVIRVSRKVSSAKDPYEVRTEVADRMKDIVSSVTASIRPDFLAYYTPPPEMQALLGNWGNNREEHRVFPGVIFAASVHARQANRHKGEQKRPAATPRVRRAAKPA